MGRCGKGGFWRFRVDPFSDPDPVIFRSLMIILVRLQGSFCGSTQQLPCNCLYSMIKGGINGGRRFL